MNQILRNTKCEDAKCQYKNQMLKESELITIGEIDGVHGIKGYVKIKSFAESSEIFSSGLCFFIGVSRGNFGAWYKLIKATSHKKGVIALFEGVNREIAETLVGKSIFILREDLPELESDTYYWQDLVGIKVVDVHLGYLGVIDYIIPTGSNDVFVVKSNDNHEQKDNRKGKIELNKGKNKEILIPALSWVVLSVDLDNREMSVNLPPGLKDEQ
ncbi:MAG: 16S rRNA processing protein RimM [Desulfamplus sp.]|nr:16S rRNA processing protein RimM [Desulfamplus sp.]